MSDQHTSLLKLASKMEENRSTIRHDRGADQRTCGKLSKTALVEMHEQMLVWITECQYELAARPSPEGRDNIADAWLNSLTRKKAIIKELIDSKS